MNSIDLDAATLRVERSLEQTKAGLVFKKPKTNYGRRTISLPPHAIKVLRDHRRQQLEIRMQLGLGKPEPDALVFSDHEGEPLLPNNMSRRWQDVCISRGRSDVPRPAPHQRLGADPRQHRRCQSQPALGHADPTVTLRTYAHLFRKVDTTAASAIELALTQGAGTR